MTNVNGKQKGKKNNKTKKPEWFAWTVTVFDVTANDLYSGVNLNRSYEICLLFEMKLNALINNIKKLKK